jgi:hypothetical protein
MWKSKDGADGAVGDAFGELDSSILVAFVALSPSLL